MVLELPFKKFHNIVQSFILQARTSIMRIIIRKKNSTHAERKFAEELKKRHIPFKHRVKINNLEIDFVIGKYAVEIDGHNQNPERNKELTTLGYTPIHFHNNEIDSQKQWLAQIFSQISQQLAG